MNQVVLTGTIVGGLRKTATRGGAKRVKFWIKAESASGIDVLQVTAYGQRAAKVEQLAKHDGTIFVVGHIERRASRHSNDVCDECSIVLTDIEALGISADVPDLV